MGLKGRAVETWHVMGRLMVDTWGHELVGSQVLGGEQQGHSWAMVGPP